MNIPIELRYMKTHEWVKNENGKIKVGITDHAQHEITDVVHVEFPNVGKKIKQGDPCVVVESVKAAFDIYAPVSGTIVAVNERLSSQPELVNQSPYDDGYFILIEPSDIKELNTLMSSSEYAESIK